MVGPVLEAELVEEEPAAPGAPRTVAEAPLDLAPWRVTPTRQPILPTWVTDGEEFRAFARWLAGSAWYHTAAHAVRSPKYVGRAALCVPPGLLKTVAVTWRWVFDMEASALRSTAVDGRQVNDYMRLTSQQNDRIRQRGIVALAGVALLALFWWLGLPRLPWWAQGVVFAAAFFALARLGRPADKRIMDVVTITQPGAVRLTADIVSRALGSLGIPRITEAVGPRGEGITYASPIQRDGPGWRADVDLPYGVTVAHIMAKRPELASGLRRPLGAVWPETAPHEHPGRCILWVGDRDMNKARQPVWPLSKKGRVDIFGQFPFATDQRGRIVPLSLIELNMLFGSLPGGGKSNAMRLALLAAGLDPYVEVRAFEFKGTADLESIAKFAHDYGLGVSDDNIEACLLSLREVHKDLERRARVIAKLPKERRPDNKVTPELARVRSLGLQPLVFAVDECQELFSHEEHGKEAGALCVDIIKRGRALGVILLLATQRPDKDSLPTGVSGNVGIRFCLRVMGQVENDMVLGTSSYKNGIRATTLTIADKGIGFLVGASEEAQIVRTFKIDGVQADKIADRALSMRQDAGTLTGYAVGDAPVRAPAYTVVDDLGVVYAQAERLWSEVVCQRLAELRPDAYTGWGPNQLAAAVKPYGITTQQIWMDDEDGTKRNRWGLTREAIMEAVNRRAEAKAAGIPLVTPPSALAASPAGSSARTSGSWTDDTPSYLGEQDS
jgi:S-DNA-T family DNA segregation ATPase FtsK/SpoIIIE